MMEIRNLKDWRLAFRVCDNLGMQWANLKAVDGSLWLISYNEGGFIRYRLGEWNGREFASAANLVVLEEVLDALSEFYDPQPIPLRLDGDALILGDQGDGGMWAVSRVNLAGYEYGFEIPSLPEGREDITYALGRAAPLCSFPFIKDARGMNMVMLADVDGNRYALAASPYYAHIIHIGSSVGDPLSIEIPSSTIPLINLLWGESFSVSLRGDWLVAEGNLGQIGFRVYPNPNAVKLAQSILGYLGMEARCSARLTNILPVWEAMRAFRASGSGRLQIQMGDGKVEFYWEDEYRGHIRTTVPSQTDGRGSIYVSLEFFSKLIKPIPEDAPIQMDIVDMRFVRISADSHHCVLAGMV